ncbi:TetR/AcrR family transcriptional regulator [Microbacterium sp. NPDC058062]|uniref:TetR/AcrR family transcriptional regulator n=1 Tax=Microbacterium sp. NPDC058062 TaxID=3346320 RepID=UPI0036DADFA2
MSSIESQKPSQRRTRARRRGTGDRRAELIEQLQSMFLAEGFSALTVDDLCARLHCSKTTLYSVADSREQIVQAVVRHFFAESAQAIEAELGRHTQPADRVVTYLSGVGTAMRRNSPEFYADMVSYQPTAAIYRLNSDAAARRVRQLIDEGVAAGDFTPGYADFTAHAVAVLIDGVQSGRLLEATGLTAGEAFTDLGEILINGLARRD